MAITKKLPPFSVEEDGNKVIYQTGPVYYINAKQGMVLADHTHDEAETIWMINGEAELQVGESIEQVAAPCEFHIEPNAYHKLTAITDIAFVEQRHEE